MLRTVEFGGWKGCFLGLCNGVNDQNRDGDGALLRNCNQGYDNVMFHAKVSHISTSMLESDPIWLVQSDPPSHFWKSKTIKMIFSFRNCWFKSLLKQQSTWGKNIQSPWVHLEFQNHDSFLFFCLINQPGFHEPRNSLVSWTSRFWIYYVHTCDSRTDVDRRHGNPCDMSWGLIKGADESWRTGRCWKFLVLWGNHQVPRWSSPIAMVSTGDGHQPKFRRNFIYPWF